MAHHAAIMLLAVVAVLASAAPVPTSDTIAPAVDVPVDIESLKERNVYILNGGDTDATFSIFVDDDLLCQRLVPAGDMTTEPCVAKGGAFIVALGPDESIGMPLTRPLMFSYSEVGWGFLPLADE